MPPNCRKSGFGLSAMFVVCGPPVLLTASLSFQESWGEGLPGTPGMSEALIEMVLSSFEPSGRVTCKLDPDLWCAVMLRSKSHATLCAASLVTVQMIVTASVYFAFGVHRWETIGAVME